MKKTVPVYIFMVLIAFLWFGQMNLMGQTEGRYFDSASSQKGQVCLTIFDPSPGHIHTLQQLKKQGLISIENLMVIGVFHDKQLANYQASVDYVKKQNMEWLKFHKLSGELESDTLFQKNSLTEELQNIFCHSNGIILFGGADIPPSVYKEKTHILTHIRTPYRHFLETCVVFHLLGGWQDAQFKPFLASHPEFPILGLCLGAQSLNVGTGGTLIQDIWSEVYETAYLEDIISLSPDNWHKNPSALLYPGEKLRSSHLHPIKLLEAGKFVRTWRFNESDTPYVYSSHHQALEKLGKGLKIIATSLDGRVPEAVEHEEFPHVLGVQFHPEALSLWNDSRKSRLTPKDKEKTSLRSILESHSPSVAFHKKLWSWFSQKLRSYHKKRIPH